MRSRIKKIRMVSHKALSSTQCCSTSTFIKLPETTSTSKTAQTTWPSCYDGVPASAQLPWRTLGSRNKQHLDEVKAKQGFSLSHRCLAGSTWGASSHILELIRQSLLGSPRPIFGGRRLASAWQEKPRSMTPTSCRAAINPGPQ